MTQQERWKPNEDEEYWAIEVDGQVACVSAYPDEIIEWDFLIGNCFKTKEEAEEYKKQIEYTARYKNYIEEHSEQLDWNDLCNHKYCAEYDSDENEIKVNWYASLKSQGVIYASSEQIIWNAIKEIGEDNFKKYVLGVK